MMGIRGIGLPLWNAPSREAATLSAEWPRPRPRQGRRGRPDKRNTVTVNHLMAQTFTTELWGAGSQVPADMAALGLKSAPFFHIACMTTANLRATATAARLKPRRFLRARPHRRRSLSPCTRVSIVVAAS